MANKQLKTIKFPNLDNIYTIPTKVGDLTNDKNYQTGDQVSQSIATAVGKINSFEVKIVQSLPTSGIDTHTIYFVPKSGIQSDVYDEYMYLNNKWEMVGNTLIDLSDYAKTQWVTTELGKKQNTINSSNKLPASNVSGLSTVATSGKYSDLSGVPTKISQFTNDSEFITISSVPKATNTTPKPDGTAKVGTEVTYARGDHVHPSDTTKANATDVNNLQTTVGNLQTEVNTLKSTVAALQEALNGIVFYSTIHSN